MMDLAVARWVWIPSSPPQPGSEAALSQCCIRVLAAGARARALACQPLLPRPRLRPRARRGPLARLVSAPLFVARPSAAAAGLNPPRVRVSAAGRAPEVLWEGAGPAHSRLDCHAAVGPGGGSGWARALI